MLTHLVLMTLKPDAPEGRAAEIVAALRALPAAIPELKEYRVGVDAGLAEGNHQIGVVAGFDDEAGWRAYVAAPAHQKVIAELIRPVLAERAGIQFTT